MFELRKAKRSQAKIRIGMAGPSGSGKTYSALKLARGLVSDWDKIVLIDTENKRGDLYSHLGGYNIITLEAPFSPERFVEAIHSCEQAGMEMIIIDSSSHEWEGAGGCLEINEKLAATKFKGNTWAAWSETTPRHQKFIEAIIASPCHVITTMRSKTDTIQTEDKKIKKVGLKEIQREGFEYELTVSFNIDRDNHYVTIGKDNTEIFDKFDPFIITEEHGKLIREWNETGAVEKPTEEQNKIFAEQLKHFNLTKEQWNEKTKSNWDTLPEKKAQEWLNVQQKKIDLLEAEKVKEPKSEKEEMEDLANNLGGEIVVEEESTVAQKMKQGMKQAIENEKGEKV